MATCVSLTFTLDVVTKQTQALPVAVSNFILLRSERPVQDTKEKVIVLMSPLRFILVSRGFFLTLIFIANFVLADPLEWNQTNEACNLEM